MGSLTVRNVDDWVKKRLRLRAAENGHSLEQELREILARAAGDSASRKKTETVGLGDAIRQRFAPMGGVELPLPIRRGRKAPEFK